MKIKEVETMLDIPKATIRFYEKEGLLTPNRNFNSYRDYNDENIIILKKIIILRKIGISVEDIKNILNESLSLQDALTKNIDNLNTQIKEIEGAIKICSLMQNNSECIQNFDQEFYWDAIINEENKGNMFFDIINDVIEFEKKVIAKEFGLIDKEGNMMYSYKTSIILSFAMCVIGGLVWYFMDNMNINSFVEGFIFPFVCIIITSIFGLPLHFLEKKNKQAADILKKIGYVICVAIVILMVIAIIVIK